ncbi:MAG TPA: 30S ribosomal protein S4 [Candidatus Nanoarchaeia archaeon]|nr:30S ribosomal protein S4 [Candidatus Nanoarchaeia archaeon]
MIRKHKKFSRPKKAFDAPRIQNENVIVEKYGLKNKREIWKAKAKLDIMRKSAKKLVDADLETQERFISKLRNKGFNVKNIVDVLALTEEDILKRRLQTIVFNKKIATTAKGARQMITHGHISINSKKVNIPSYNVNVDEESKINGLTIKKSKISKEEKQEEINPVKMEVEN